MVKGVGHPPAEWAYVSGDQLAELLPYPGAVQALAAAFAGRRDASPPRVPVTLPTGELLLMPAFGAEGVGVKLVTLSQRPGRASVQGVYVLFAPDGLAPELIIDGAALTARRTAAVSALATRQLARPESRRLVVFGAGAQAAAHIEAMSAVRPITSVAIVARTWERAHRLVAAVRAAGLAAEVELSAEKALAQADIVCTCTPSTEALFDDKWLGTGAHVNAVGAYRLDMRELPAATLARALLVVESREAALAEAGDIAQAIAEGAVQAGHMAGELGDLAAGTLARTSAEQVTVFKSVGLAAEDLVLARAVADRLPALG